MKALGILATVFFWLVFFCAFPWAAFPGLIAWMIVRWIAAEFARANRRP